MMPRRIAMLVLLLCALEVVAGSAEVSHPSAKSTRVKVDQPKCEGGSNVLILARSCVLATPPELESFPDDLPRISFDIKPIKPFKVTVFLISDEDKDAYEALVAPGARATAETCEKLAGDKDRVVVPYEEGVESITGTEAITGTQPHMWYIVAVDCEALTCPGLRQAEINYFHPNSDGAEVPCTAGVLSFEGMKYQMLQGWQSLSIRNVLDVGGVSQLGVAVLYAAFATMVLCSLLFAGWGHREPEQEKRQMYLFCGFATTISALSYLSMASGNGLLILRKISDQGWAYSDPLLSTRGAPGHENPLYDSQYAAKPTYPFFYARYIDWFLSTPLLLCNLCTVVGAKGDTVRLLLFLNAAMVTCAFLSTAVTDGSRWAYFVAALFFYSAMAGVIRNELRVMGSKAVRPTRRLFHKLGSNILIVWALYMLTWLFCEGTKVLSSDLDIILYVILDVVAKPFYGFTIRPASLRGGEVQLGTGPF
mmetsp:Transcript_31312/g.76748  ORF Transcript_31312/g.76748 Transcript_31312/m.76748 type:complete len:479 (+) Transcript_31312:420-1856(+)